MIVFVDFEASSLAKHGFPIQVGWAAEDGGEEVHLIRPAPEWTEWDMRAERIHGIPLERLHRDGELHDAVARRMVEVLTGHDLFATAPSWDGQWLSLLLRAAGLPRHALRLRDTDEAEEAAARTALSQMGVPEHEVAELVPRVLEAARAAAREHVAAHDALADAQAELHLWRDIPRHAREIAAIRGGGAGGTGSE